MARIARTILTLTLTIAATSTALADPIRVTVSFSNMPGNQKSFFLPDDFATAWGQITPGSVWFNRFNLPPYAYGPDGQQVAFRQPLDRTFQTVLSFDHATEGLPAVTSPALWISAILQGELFDDNPTDSNLAGHLRSTDIFLQRYETSPGDLTPIPADIRAVLDAFLEIGRVSISGSVQGGRDNIMPIVLTVSPAPVPEPTTWAAWTLLGAAGWTIRQRRRSRAAARTDPAARPRRGPWATSPGVGRGVGDVESIGNLS